MTQAEHDLWAGFADGSISARNRLVEFYLPVVRGLAHGFHANGLIETDDLISAGVIGLIRSVERYDPDRQVPFPAFAKVRIRGAMQDWLRQIDILTRGLREKGTAPSVTTLEHDVMEPLDEECQDPRLERIFRRLKPRSRQILEMYFLQGMKMKAIGKRLGLSETSISLNLTRIIAETREALA
jgi:RNA polymerase sigma factor for flagellar operon FliA